MIVKYNAQTAKHNAGTSLAPVIAHETINENIENINVASRDISSSNLSLRSKYKPIHKKMKRIPETTNNESSEIKPNLNGIAVKRDTGNTNNQSSPPQRFRRTAG